MLTTFPNMFTTQEKQEICERLRKIQGIIPESFRTFEVHSGFAYEYRQLRADIYNKFKNGCFTGLDHTWRFLITGHSLAEP